MRIRYTINTNGTWTSRKTIAGPSTNYTVELNLEALTYTVTGEDNSTLTGTGDDLVSLKKNVRFGLASLGVNLGVEKRNRKSVDTFNLDTHATLAAKVE